MKRSLLIILTVVLAMQAAVAQNPRAVIKSVYKGDSLSVVTEKYDKARKNNPDTDPSMRLMDAVYFNAAGAPVEAYYCYCASRSEIEGSNDIAKMLKSLQLRLQDVFGAIESASLSEVLRLDTEDVYDRYLEVASANNHPSLDILVKSREKRSFEDAVTERSVASCERFLTKFPDASPEHKESVEALRTNILFEQASHSVDESVIESFIASYPDYQHLQTLRDYLADLRYASVQKSPETGKMRDFVAMYPQHPGTPGLLSRLAEMEYQTLNQQDLDAVESYISSYPNSPYAENLANYLTFERLLLRCDLAEVFSYIRSNGYDASYPRIVKAVADRHHAFILTPDIRETSLVRFVDSKGRVGYWSADGSLAIAPKYDTWYAVRGQFSYDNAFSAEFVTGRNVATVCNNGRIGLINAQGSVVVPLRFMDAFVGDMVVMLSSEVDSLRGQMYNCERYSFSGGSLGKGVYDIAAGTGRYLRRAAFNVNVAGNPAAVQLGEKAAASLDPRDYLRVMTLDGISMGLKLRRNDSGILAYNSNCISTDKGLVNTDSWSVIGPDIYDAHRYVSENRIAVCKDGLWGYLDADMHLVIGNSYRQAGSFCGGSALVTDGSQDMLIDADGRVIFSAPRMVRVELGGPSVAQWDHYAVYMYSNGEGLWGIVDSSAAHLLEPAGIDIDARTGLAKVSFGSGSALTCVVDGKKLEYNLIELISNSEL